jgi:hypothetical protein
MRRTPIVNVNDDSNGGTLTWGMNPDTTEQ